MKKEVDRHIKYQNLTSVLIMVVSVFAAVLLFITLAFLFLLAGPQPI